MEKVLIDSFVVPEESKAWFLEQSNSVQKFLRTLPGFVEGYIYERKGGESQYNFVTTAVWANEEAVENARQAIANENQKKGANVQETLARLRIERVRSIYERFSY